MKTWEIKLMELLAIGTLTDCTPTLLNPTPPFGVETVEQTIIHINRGRRAYKFEIKPELVDTFDTPTITTWSNSLRKFIHQVYYWYEEETK